MAYGMTYSEFWEGDVLMAPAFRKAHEIKLKQRDYEFWLQGLYIYDGIAKLSPAFNAFSKAKPHKYVEKPYMQELEEKKEQQSDAAAGTGGNAIMDYMTAYMARDANRRKEG